MREPRNVLLLSIALGGKHDPRFAHEDEDGGDHYEHDESSEHEDGRYARGKKESKSEVEYGPGSFCGLCKHFLQPGRSQQDGRCELVAGKIQIWDWCKLFERRKAEHEDHEGKEQE
jgi:hypothetical protein